jgi:hypothetical protein
MTKTGIAQCCKPAEYAEMLRKIYGARLVSLPVAQADADYLDAQCAASHAEQS